MRCALDAVEDGRSAEPLVSYIDDSALWSCTTCGACNESCPVGIEVFDKIIDLRRGRVETGDVPAAAESVFENSAQHLNPFGRPQEDRMAWAHGLSVRIAAEGEPVELLYWIGCSGSYDPEGRSVSQAMIKLLNYLGVNYRVLGKAETCTGDPARRIGEEGLFEQLAEENHHTFARHRVQRILTHCPHCFNTFKNEYPQRGPTPEVEHHSQFLARMVNEGRLQAKRQETRAVTFHDPCYLGRGNGETTAPRSALSTATAQRLVEMPRHGRGSFCCGAGGGNMWLDVPGRERIENLRAREARATGAEIVATGCPFCKTMLSSSLQVLPDGQRSIPVKDIAEIWADAIDP
jgi:Fe-S oxidoreductase